MGQAQIVNTLGAPFVLEGLFGEVNAEAMDTEPNSELAGDAMGMYVEDDVEGAAVTADGGMIVDNDGAAANNIGTLCVFQPTEPRLETVKNVYCTVGPRPRHNNRLQTQTQMHSLTRHCWDFRTCGRCCTGPLEELEGCRSTVDAR